MPGQYHVGGFHDVLPELSERLRDAKDVWIPFYIS